VRYDIYITYGGKGLQSSVFHPECTGAGVLVLPVNPDCRWGNVVQVTYRTVSFGAKSKFLIGGNSWRESK
jgi:hypothetical protein